MTKYDSSGENVGVGFDLVALRCPITLTIYVYPGPSLRSAGSSEEVIAAAREHQLSRAFASLVADLQESHPEYSAPAESATSMQLFDRELRGYHAVFVGTEKLGLFERATHSHATLFMYDGWLIKLRATYPLECEMQAEDALAEFMQAFSLANELGE